MPNVMIKLLNGEIQIHEWEWTTEDEFEHLRMLRIESCLRNCPEGRFAFEENEVRYTQDFSMKKDLDQVLYRIRDQLAEDNKMITCQVKLVSCDGRIILPNMIYDDQAYTKEFPRDVDTQVNVYELWTSQNFETIYAMFEPIEDVPYIMCEEIAEYFRLNDMKGDYLTPTSIVWFNLGPPCTFNKGMPLLEVFHCADPSCEVVHNFNYLNLWFDDNAWIMTPLAKTRLDRLREKSFLLQ